MNGDQPAFPCEGGDNSGLHPHPGMTYRQWLAGMVFQGALAGKADEAIIEKLLRDGKSGDLSDEVARLLAEDAWKLIDALIAAEKGEGK